MLPEAGATELIFIAAVALIVVGPKDLPALLRKVGQFTAKMRGLAAEFRSSFDELARQSELDELRREVDALRTGQYMAPIVKEIDHHRQEIDQHFNDLHKEFGAAPPMLDHGAILPGPDAVPALPAPAWESAPIPSESVPSESVHGEPVQGAPARGAAPAPSEPLHEPPEWPQLSLPLSGEPSDVHVTPASADPARETAG